METLRGQRLDINNARQALNEITKSPRKWFKDAVKAKAPVVPVALVDSCKVYSS